MGKYLLVLEPFIVGPAVLAATFFNREFLPVLGVALAFWGLRYLVQGRFSVRTPLDIPLVFLGLMMPVAWAISVRPEVTRVQVYRFGLSVALYYSVVNWVTNEWRLRWALRGTGLTGLGLALASILSIEAWPQGKAFYVPAEVLTFLRGVNQRLPDSANPNILAGYLILFAVFSWVLWASPRGAVHPVDRMVGLGIWAVLTGMSLLFQSRGAIFALAGGSLVYVTLRLWQVDRRLLLVWCGGLVLGAIYLRVGLWEAWQTSPQWRSLLTTYEQRWEIWTRGVYLVQSFPFTGVGMGLYSPVVDILYPFYFSTPGQVPHAHNLFLQAAVDLGIAGGVAWLAIILIGGWCAWEMCRTPRKPRTVQAVGTAFWAVQTALVVHGLMDAVPWFHSRPVPLLWALWGLLMAAWRLPASSQGVLE